MAGASVHCKLEVWEPPGKHSPAVGKNESVFCLFVPTASEIHFPQHLRVYFLPVSLPQLDSLNETWWQTWGPEGIVS